MHTQKLTVYQAIRQLIIHGYKLWVDGDKIRFKYMGQDKLDPKIIVPLFEFLKKNKPEAFSYFTRIHDNRPEMPLSCKTCGLKCNLETMQKCLGSPINTHEKANP